MFTTFGGFCLIICISEQGVITKTGMDDFDIKDFINKAVGQCIAQEANVVNKVLVGNLKSYLPALYSSFYDYRPI